jgi:hypothetical protein
MSQDINEESGTTKGRVPTVKTVEELLKDLTGQYNEANKQLFDNQVESAKRIDALTKENVEIKTIVVQLGRQMEIFSLFLEKVFTEHYLKLPMSKEEYANIVKQLIAEVRQAN